MKPEVLMYSSDENLTFTDLKNLDSNHLNIPIQDLQEIQTIFEKNDIHGVMPWDEYYHPKFHTIPSKPYIMHYIWDISLLDRQILGIVWPRKPSLYSPKVLQKFFDYAKNYNLVTVSGMAEWVDQLCHSFSIKNDIPTIAVLWWWINKFLQGPNRHIIDCIVSHWWLILSEFKINFTPTKFSFPQRNRIVAALSDILFLPEAWENSGSLITAGFAYNMSKPVYAVPNDIFCPTSIWVNQLFSKQQAIPLFDFECFFAQNFQKKITASNEKNLPELPAEQNQIMKILSTKWEMSLNWIMNETQMNTDTIMTHITLLEINNYVYQTTPWTYCIK